MNKHLRLLLLQVGTALPDWAFGGEIPTVDVSPNDGFDCATTYAGENRPFKLQYNLQMEISRQIHITGRIWLGFTFERFKARECHRIS